MKSWGVASDYLAAGESLLMVELPEHSPSGPGQEVVCEIRIKQVLLYTLNTVSRVTYINLHINILYCLYTVNIILPVLIWTKYLILLM